MKPKPFGKNYKYAKAKSGEPHQLNWRNSILYLACCDCSLVHKMSFTVKGDNLVIRAWRHDKETKRLRLKTGWRKYSGVYGFIRHQ